MSKLSVVIPSRNKQYLAQTIEDLFDKAAGDVEVIAVFDGYDPGDLGIRRDNLKLIRLENPEGMRQAINAGANAATGEYLMKSDEHCMFARGYDEVLKADCDDNWICVPRRYALNPDKWGIDPGHGPTDAHYLSWPWLKPLPHWVGTKWPERTAARKDVPIDDEMSSQGSCWFMRKKYFFKHIGQLDWKNYGGFSQEFQELAFKTWLGGGRVVCNKKTWYAHWHKPHEFGRGYHLSKGEQEKGWRFSFDYWWNDRWPERLHDIEWLIDKFWPVPGWPENWKERYGLRGSDEIDKAG